MIKRYDKSLEFPTKDGHLVLYDDYVKGLTDIVLFVKNNPNRFIYQSDENIKKWIIGEVML